jgi:hypothetical protein
MTTCHDHSFMFGLSLLAIHIVCRYNDYTLYSIDGGG